MTGSGTTHVVDSYEKRGLISGIGYEWTRAFQNHAELDDDSPTMIQMKENVIIFIRQRVWLRMGLEEWKG